jgi:glycosyltransferase 2 family protein
MKKYYNYFLYLSLLGVVYSLYKSDYLLVPEIRNVWHLSLSIVFLSAGILIQCFNWKIALKIFHIKIDSKNAIISHGQSIFMKYVPGKVMSVLGRSMYISREYGLSISKTTSASLIAQLLSLGTGASFALVYIFNDQIPSAYKISIFLFLFLILTFFILFNSIRKAVYSLGLKFKKRIILPKVEPIRFITAFPFFYISWFLAGVGFYFFQ